MQSDWRWPVGVPLTAPRDPNRSLALVLEASSREENKEVLTITMETAEKRAHMGGSTDNRLSALQDDLLHHILSLLLCQWAMQMIVLSKRWTSL
jgi:hypothetical protein